ncbi:MAG: site-specific integrase [Candidatus Thermoplasmatota archaeon]
MGRYPLRTAIEKYMDANKQYLAEATLTERGRKLRAFASRYEKLCRGDPLLERNPCNWGEREVSAILLDIRRRQWSLGTQSKEVENLQALLRFSGNGVLDRMKSCKPHLFPKRVSTRGPSLAVEELESALKAAANLGGWTGEIARFLIATHAYTGLRPGELRKAEFSDLDTVQWTLKVRHPKGESRYGDHRIVAIPQPLRSAVARYLKAREQMLAERGLLEAKPLVCPLENPTGFYSSNHLRRVKRKVEERSGVRFELRTLRRTYGQNLLNRGVSLESVSLALGHSSTLTTERYYCRKDADSARLEIVRAFEKPAPAPRLNSPLIEPRADYTGYA